MNATICPPARRHVSRNVIFSALLAALLLLTAGCAGGPIAASWAGVSADAHGLVMADLNRVVRLNATGTERWVFPPASAQSQTQFYAPPALTEDVVYAGGYDFKVYAIDRDNGTQIWVNADAQDRIIAGPAVGHGKVFVGVSNRGVLALNQQTGERVWYFETGHGVWAAPLVLEDAVIVTSLDHFIYALDVDTGEEIWRQDLLGAVAGTPAYLPGEEGPGVLYVGSFARKLFALSASTGEILRTFDTRGWLWDGPALLDGTLYFGDMSGYLYALDAATFDPLWQRQVAADALRATPLVTPSHLVIGSRDDRVYTLDRETGAQIWAQPVGADVLSPPVLLDEDTVVVSTLNPQTVLIAFAIADGRQEWTYPPVTGQ